MAPKLKLWAVGIKGWVEIRESTTQPKVKVDSIITKTKQMVLDRYDEGGWPPRYKYIYKEAKLSQYVASGGKLIGTISTQKLALLAKIKVGPGGTVEILPPYDQKVRAYIQKGL